MVDECPQVTVNWSVGEVVQSASPLACSPCDEGRDQASISFPIRRPAPLWQTSFDRELARHAGDTLPRGLSASRFSLLANPMWLARAARGNPVPLGTGGSSPAGAGAGATEKGDSSPGGGYATPTIVVAGRWVGGCLASGGKGGRVGRTKTANYDTQCGVADR